MISNKIKKLLPPDLAAQLEEHLKDVNIDVIDENYFTIAIQ